MRLVYLIACLALLVASYGAGMNAGQELHLKDLQQRIERLESTRKANLTIFDRSWQE
jgi:hypothetical protein